MRLSVLAISMIFILSGAAFAEDTRKSADELFAERDYSEAGMQKALDAAQMYGRLVDTAKSNEKNQLWIAQAKSYYFVGTGKKDKKEKIELFQKGIDAAMNVVKQYVGELKQQTLETTAKEVLAKVHPTEVLELAQALYYEGINLGSWAEANGVTQSLNKWPTLRNYMMLVDLLGHKQINHYGSSRVLGRAYYRLPVLAGGDMEKARKYLGEAFSNTRADDNSPSLNGNNNIFYAELLNKDSKKEEAIKVLKNFINTPADKLDADSIPENKALQATAKAILADWEE